MGVDHHSSNQEYIEAQECDMAVFAEFQVAVTQQWEALGGWGKALWTPGKVVTLVREIQIKCSFNPNGIIAFGTVFF